MTIHAPLTVLAKVLGLVRQAHESINTASKKHTHTRACRMYTLACYDEEDVRLLWWVLPCCDSHAADEHGEQQHIPTTTANRTAVTSPATQASPDIQAISKGVQEETPVY